MWKPRFREGRNFVQNFTTRNWRSWNLISGQLIPETKFLCYSESHSAVSDSLQSHGLYGPWNSPGQNPGVGSPSLLSRGSSQPREQNPGLPHCRRILYQLSHKGSPTTEVGSLSLLQQIFPSQELNRVSCIAGGFFTNWAIREVLCYSASSNNLS